MKHRYFFFFIIFVFFTNCKEKPFANIENSKAKVTEVKYGKPFFNFDEVDYYFTEITEEDAMKLMEKSDSKILEQSSDVILNDEFPKSLNNTDFIKNFTKIGFKKYQIKSSKFSELNKIFVEKSPQDGITYSCIPVFRDVLIFKKNHKITGIVKVCFDCHQYHIVGAKGNTENFGEGDDYEKLGKILDQAINN